MKLNRLLNKQILKHLPPGFIESEQGSQFIAAVNNSYHAYERDIELLNHAFRINEEEYMDINKKLKEEIHLKRVSISRLKDSIHSISVKTESFKQENNSDELLDIVNYLDNQINSRKQAEEVYTSLIKNLQSGILLEDEEGHVIFANQLFCDMFGLPVHSETLAGTSWGDAATKLKQLFVQEDNFAAAITAILSKKVIVSGDMLTLKDGRIFMREYIPLYINHVYKGHLWKYDDISEKIASENKLKESESRFRITLERLGDNVWEHDFSTGKSYFSNTDPGLLDYTENEDQNYATVWWNSIYPEDLHIVQESNENYKAGKADHHQLEYRMMHKDGTIKWILDKGVMIQRNADGTPLKIIGTHTDITSMKEIENALRESEEQFRSLSENIPGVLFSYCFEKNGTNGFSYISPSIEKILGIDAATFASPQKYIHPEDIGLFKEKISAAINSNDPIGFEGRILIQGKPVTWMDIASSFSFEREDGARIYTGIITDITQRKMIEETLRIREEKYRNITANMRLGLLEVDNDEIITFANQSFCDMSGYDTTELLGVKASLLFAKDQHVALLQQKNELRKQGHSDAYEISLHNKNGDPKWWLISGAPHYNDKGELIGSIGIHLDITRQKKLENDLMEAKLQAEKSAQAKELFLANMSHEIRTPMNAIMGMSHQLTKTTLNSRQSLFLDAIHNSAEHLLVIINDILDISKIEAGKLNLENIGFNLSTIVKSAMQVMQHKAEEKGLMLDISIDENIDPVLIGDPYRFKQVLLNMISNSIKFTEKGAVQVDCRLHDKIAKGQLLRITITDTGIGMDEGFLGQLFTKFSQEDNSVARKYGGTGLGMSICKKLIELMNGAIAVSSKKNQGTAITFTLPFLTGTERDLPEKETVEFDSSILKGSRILLVEDNEMNRLVATTVLELYEVDFMEATNGEEAIAMLQQQSFDLVLMDVQMPVMNGMEATKIIRQRINASIPIIALTANAIKGESDKCITAGMNAYISKPFEEAVLVRTIGTLLGKEMKTDTLPKDQPVAQESLFDLVSLRALSRGDEKFVTKIISLFIKTAPASVLEMKKALHNNDFEKVKSVAHSLKPSIDSLGIAGMKTRIREIESFPFADERSGELHRLIEESGEIISSVIVSFQKQFAV